MGRANRRIAGGTDRSRFPEQPVEQVCANDVDDTRSKDAKDRGHGQEVPGRARVMFGQGSFPIDDDGHRQEYGHSDQDAK